MFTNKTHFYRPTKTTCTGPPSTLLTTISSSPTGRDSSRSGPDGRTASSRAPILCRSEEREGRRKQIKAKRIRSKTGGRRKNSKQE